MFDQYSRTFAFGGGDTVVAAPGQQTFQRAGRRIRLDFVIGPRWVNELQDADMPTTGGPAALWNDRIVTLTPTSTAFSSVMLWTAPLLQPPGWVHFGPFAGPGEAASIITDPTRDRFVIFGGGDSIPERSRPGAGITPRSWIRRPTAW